ncbi:PREDICTED: uncharacterized protein LOC108568995 [Nicrophorus vespilloides]|uniref:Uncharacterized protein LOC108568995 n=1 Tax=Nicrophorus vespilloides TaxID=110193 RepID=A0ABM1NGA1_NICVS|nr:PREDICTED: uncharacterized protein LOC108568995 [Nicrophorus vespilloides]
MSSLKQIEEDLKLFHEYCVTNNLSRDEIAEICKPLRTPMKFRSAIYLVLFITALYYLSYIETVSWHLTAIGRILMIKLLPFYDWQLLKNERCLIPKTTMKSSKECYFCETTTAIPFTTSFKSLQDQYIDLNMPVVLKLNESKYNSSDEMIKDIFEIETYADSSPCKLATNLKRRDNVQDLLEATLGYDQYFMHFQNCDFYAVKAFREIVSRPRFLPAETAPIQYSWILLSKHYESGKFKPIDLKDTLAVVLQMVGSNLFNLIPIDCEQDCDPLQIELIENEALILTSSWDLEYRTLDNGDVDNLAVILETH